MGRVRSCGVTPLALVCVLLATSACGEDSSSGGDGASGSPSVMPTSNPTGDGTIVQGHVVGRDPLVGTAETFTAFVSGAYYDRCNGDAIFDAASNGTPSVTFTVPATTGTFAAGYAGVAPSGLAAGEATVKITHIDENRVEGVLSSGAVSGPFVLDACGHFGQTLFASEPCDLQDGSSYRTAVAVSPQGRIAVSDIDGWTRVFRRTGASGTCTYEIDTAYASSGEFTARSEQLEFDDSERLYAATFPGSIQPDAPGGIVRMGPDGSVESCLNASQLSASVIDSPPDHFVVLRDGSAAYASWGGGERRIDLTSPSLGSGTVECSYETSTDSVTRYATALSVHDDGFLFFRQMTLDDPVRAEVTGLDLAPLLRFGGTTSGAGAEGFMDTRAGSRCSAGFCMASGTGLAVYSDGGAFREFIQWYTELEGRQAGEALAATEGNDADAYVVLEVDNGLVGVRLSMPPL